MADRERRREVRGRIISADAGAACAAAAREALGGLLASRRCPYMLQ